MAAQPQLVQERNESPIAGGSGVEHSRVGRWSFTANAAALCAVGLLVVFVSYGLELDVNMEEQRRNAALEVGLLQPLITGNLAVFLTWVWLDLRMPRRDEKDLGARFGLWFIAAAVAGVSTFGGTAWRGMLKGEPFVPFLLFLVAPVLVVAVPLLWTAARRVERSWLRTLMLASVVAASAAAQHGHGTGNGAELRVFTMNSCLIGLVVAIWLAVWAGEPPSTAKPNVEPAEAC